jgi:hypothetical protein
MLSVVGIFITIQPGLFLIVLAIAMISALVCTLAVRHFFSPTLRSMWVLLSTLILFFAVQATLYRMFLGVNIIRVEYVHNLSQPKFSD